MPPAAASAEPKPNVNEITTPLFTPIKAAAVGFKDRARIASPMRVRMTTNRRATSRTLETANTRT